MTSRWASLWSDRHLRPAAFQSRFSRTTL